MRKATSATLDGLLDLAMKEDSKLREWPHGDWLGQGALAFEDHSQSATHGNVYVLGSVNPPGPDPLDVMFIRSTDGGQTWELARLNHPLSPYSWVFWTYQWSPPRLGDHRLMARATDGTGQVQSSTEKAPFPDGASGLQEVIVAVEE